jgi:hypothetical protein
VAQEGIEAFAGRLVETRGDEVLAAPGRAAQSDNASTAVTKRSAISTIRSASARGTITPS